MIELVDAQPAVEVPQAEYNRLLGYPRGWTLEGRASELAEWARQWYAEHGRPWIYARLAESIHLPEGRVVIDGEPFASATLENMLRQAGADGAALVAVSAGPELEAEAARAWRDGRPDEYFFLEVFGSAVVERLTTLAGAQLCAWADGQSLAVLPHHSPGYPSWDVAEQPLLAALVKRNGRRSLPAALDVLDSGMLRPKKSQLAVFGLTRHVERVERIADLVPCHRCCLVGCDYRRAAYRGPAPFSGNETLVALGAAPTPQAPAGPLDLAARYTVNAKALVRWTRERLVLHQRDDGAIDARFRYDGTTCTNLGRPLAFDYTVRLGRRDDGYPVEDASCVPADGDDGARSMCRYLDEGDSVLDRIAAERPLAGARLDEVLSWRRPECAAGCFCDDEGREHKWGLVLETIHYALAQRERCGSAPLPQDTPAMKVPLLDALKSRPLVGDGAMGTQLMFAGLEQGGCGEAWNLTHPERVLAIQRRYADAGSDCIITNTFGGSRIMLNRHGHAGDAVAVNKAAVELTRLAFGSRDGYVLGDVGPFGGLMEPYGDFSAAEVRAAFDEQARALVEAGADAIIVETQTSLEELALALRAAREAGAPCVIGSMAYDVTLDGSTFRTMMGVDPERAAEFMQQEGADVVALNCGTGMDMERARQAVERYRRVTDLPVMAQPNAGQPRLVDMKVVYDETPAEMVGGVAPLLEAGANIVGACCGSTPDHIRAFRTAVDAYLASRSAAAAGALE